MKKKDTYELLVEKMYEVSTVPPQTLGPFTLLYKKFVPYLKFSPWRSILIVSGLASLLLYLLLGNTLVKLVSLLQFGF